MHAICKDAIENAQLGAPAASVMAVALVVLGVWGLVFYLNHVKVTYHGDDE